MRERRIGVCPLEIFGLCQLIWDANVNAQFLLVFCVRECGWGAEKSEEVMHWNQMSDWLAETLVGFS